MSNATGQVSARDALRTTRMRSEGVKHVRALLDLIEPTDSKREGLSETPERVMRSYEKLFGGYDQDPGKVLKTFQVECDEIVVVKDIEIYSTCEHHMQPFFGKAHVGYLPSGRVVGLSKLARLVEIFARRLQVQERICQQVADALEEHLGPRGAGVVIEARHFCMCARGVEKQNSVALTSAMRGTFKKSHKARAEFMRLIGK